jgi:hypothetical protein
MRVLQPSIELKKYGVETDIICFLPSDPLIQQEKLLIEYLSRYDLIIVQRCYLYDLVNRIKVICEYLGKPVIFEVDDHYGSLIPSNPAYFSIVADQNLFRHFNTLNQKAAEAQSRGEADEASRLNEEAQNLLPALEQSRLQGLEGYKEVLRMVDWVTVSTEELARTVYPYNKNVIVFENQVERTYPWRDNLPLEECLVPTGEPNMFTIQIPNQLGLYMVPSYRTIKHEKLGDQIQLLPRIGYSCSPSHKYEDFYTISGALNDYLNKNRGNQFLLLIGDNASDGYWFRQHFNDQSVVFSIPPNQYEKYNFNLRNVDIGLCPLAPTMFNMSKSDLKLLEYGSWGIPGLAPRFITYSRHWVDEETCLMYYNEDEFYHQLERLCKSPALRNKIGLAAKAYIEENRLESMFAEKRYEFYKQVVANKKPLDSFAPNKVAEV